jgi:hypothetical protein
VEKAARLAGDLGREVAGPNEARDMLGIGVPERAKAAASA